MSTMPVFLRESGYRFRFFSSDRTEQPHVHVDGHGGSAKVWLVPVVTFEKARAYDMRRQNEIEKIIIEHRDEWIAVWRRFFGER